MGLFSKDKDKEKDDPFEFKDDKRKEKKSTSKKKIIDKVTLKSGFIGSRTFNVSEMREEDD